MSDTYLKPSQTSKMKFLAKVVKASGKYSEQYSVFRMYLEHLG